jgi:NodT family efflux transporter outer membrane factor (OMF) lipoprotein
MQREMLADWWRLFEDPVLDELIDVAIVTNPDRDLALARIREARAQFQISRATTRPNLSSSGTASVFESTAPTGDADWLELYDVGFDASWELDVFGGIRKSVEAAEATIEARRADYVDVMTSLAAEVALTYVDLRTLEARLQITQTNVTIQEQTFALVQWRTEAGLTTALDVVQAATNLETTRAPIPALERDLVQIRNKLSFLIGVGTAEIDGFSGMTATIPEAQEGVAIGIPADTVGQRGDIRSAERNLAVQSARVGVATANLYPSFRLVGFIGSSASDLSRLFDSSAKVSNLAATVSAPLFNAGQLRANIAVEDALYAQALASLEKTILNALREVEDALAAQTAAHERTGYLRLAVQEAERANLLASQEYEAGLTEFDRVLDTQRTLLTAQEQLVLNQSAESTATIQLYKAVGGGWDASIPTGQGT